METAQVEMRRAEAFDLPTATLLMQEYFEYMAKLFLEHGVKLGSERAKRELAALPGDFAEPAGFILVAWSDEDPAGCAALRPLAMPGACELKHMFVRPQFQRRGIGKQLGGSAIAEARGRGYRTMYLDTGKFMLVPQHLYQSLGFKRCAPYYDAPPEVLERVVFMELSL